jgi:RNA polymerase-binding transcription factor DksA
VQNDAKFLEREREKLRDQIAKLEAALEEKPDYGLGEGDPAITRWEMNLALLAQLRERSARLDGALARADKGGYGVCKRCGEPIHPDRLKVLPGTRMCVRCARMREHAQVI